MAAMDSRVERQAFDGLDAPLAVGAHVRISGIPLANAKPQSLDVERFVVWAPDAVIMVEGNGERTQIAPPDVQYFRGHVIGDPESLVFLSKSGDMVGGLIVAGDRRFNVRSRKARERMAERPDVWIEETSVLDDLPSDGQGFRCDLEQTTLTPSLQSLKLQANALGTVQATGTLGSGTATRTLNLAIETDFELYVDMGSNASVLSSYVGSLIGGTSTIYQRDLRTDLVITFIRIQNTSSDPFTIDPGTAGTWNGNPVTYTTRMALAELGDIWANAGTRPFSGARSAVMLLSGKNQTEGVAWRNTMCGADFLCGAGNCGSSVYDGHYGGRYAYCGGVGNAAGLVPDPNLTNNGVVYGLPSSNYWSLLQTAHELGHVAGSGHTHCVALSPAEQASYGVARAFVDTCYAGDGGCFTGTPSVPAEKGTVMSYCHLTASGGFPQSRFLFGKSGEPSEKVVNTMTTFLAGATPNSPAITVPASVASGVATGASVTAPDGSLTYTWFITNGTFSGGGATVTGTAATFTGTVSPVTLYLKATNANGCAASDHVAVTVTTSVTTRGDANGDGRADIFWRSPNEGFNYLWLLNGATLVASTPVASGDVPWKVAASGDFNGDGMSDIFWRRDTGENYLWLMNGATILSSVSMPSLSDGAWKVAGSGDFNGDGKADLFWRHDSSGQNSIWIFDGTSVPSMTATLAAPDVAWKVAGIGDFNTDGKNDVFWHRDSGENYMWLMNGTTVASSTAMPSSSDTTWRIAAIRDFNGDGMADVFWHRDSGENYMWLIDRTTVAASLSVLGTGDTAWKIAAAADFNGDGKSDIFWHRDTGENYVWLLNGATVQLSAPLPTGASKWQVVAPTK